MKLSTRDMILIGLFAALMAVGAYIKIPNPFNPNVPITLQLFFCIYAGVLLGSLKGALSQVIYMSIGLIGVPVFTGGGGFGYVMRPTFGYIIGFILCALVVGLIVERQKELSAVMIFLAATSGLLVNYLIGNAYFYVVMNHIIGQAMSVGAINAIMVPYMIKDFLLLIIIAVSSKSILGAIRKAGYLTV